MLELRAEDNEEIESPDLGSFLKDHLDALRSKYFSRDLAWWSLV